MSTRSITFTAGRPIDSETVAVFELRLYGRGKVPLGTSAVTFTGDGFDGAFHGLPNVAGIKYYLSWILDGRGYMAGWPDRPISYFLVPDRNPSKTAADFLPVFRVNGLVPAPAVTVTVTEEADGGGYWLEGWDDESGHLSLAWQDDDSRDPFNWTVAAPVLDTGTGPIATAASQRVKEVMEALGATLYFRVLTQDMISDPLGLDADPVPENPLILCGTVTAENTSRNGGGRKIMFPMDVAALLGSPLDNTVTIREVYRSGLDVPGGIDARVLDDPSPSREHRRSDGVAYSVVHLDSGARS